jgi:SSS family solute:Na+ symporter
VVQVIILIAGGLVTCYLAMDLVSDRLNGTGVLNAFSLLKTNADDHFHMVFDKNSKFYDVLPGISLLAGGMWINNLNYWGCNQYIVQRALGADLKTGRNGLLFAAFLKLLIPLIVVIPGIATYVLYQQGYFQKEMVDAAGTIKPDHAYPVLMNLLPSGLKGLAFAALTAAIVASLAGKSNSIATIFTLDIYKKYVNKNASERKMVVMGRWAVILSSLIAIAIAPALGSFDQIYQFIQEYVGFISPGVLSIFLLGLFWKKATSTAALTAALATIPLSVLLKFLPQLSGGFIEPIPFLNRMMWVFVITTLLMVVISVALPKTGTSTITVDRKMFRVTTGFAVSSVIICGILAALYIVFW